MQADPNTHIHNNNKNLYLFAWFRVEAPGN
jgi:hypothetical protein